MSREQDIQELVKITNKDIDKVLIGYATEAIRDIKSCEITNDVLDNLTQDTKDLTEKDYLVLEKQVLRRTNEFLKKLKEKENE